MLQGGSVSASTKYPAERIDRVRYAGLVGDDLLRPQRDATPPPRSGGDRLIEGVGVERLGAPEDPGERLDRHADDVVHRLLLGQRGPGGLHVEAHQQRATAWGAERLPHLARPDSPGGPVLGDLLEKVGMRIEEETSVGRRHRRRARARPRARHSEAVLERERELLGGGGAGLADVVSADRDRVPPRHLPSAVFDHVGDEAHRRIDREAPLLLRDVDVFTNLGFKYIPYINSLLPLKDKTLENILSSMSYNRRREINLSITENAIYKEANSKEEIEDFYEILSDLYKNKVKIPLPTIQFFLQLYESKIGKIFVVKDKEKIIGGAACLLFDQKVLYTLYYCGLKDHHPRIFPSHLAILASIEYGIKYGFEYIDLMGAGRSDKTYGVRDYKKRFGCELPEYGRFLRINNLVVYGLGKMWIRGRKFVPLFNCYIL